MERVAPMIIDRIVKFKIHINIILSIIIVVGFIFISTGCSSIFTNKQRLNNIEVYFIDVGQAEATLLKGSDFTVLVDAGDYRNDDVVTFLNDLGIEQIDLLVGTHPHSDHIGQFDKILYNFSVKEVWMSGDLHTSKTFEKAIDAIYESKANYYEPIAGESFSYGSLEIEVLNPEKLNGDFHEGCIALKAIYNDFSIIFTGDIETKTENKIIDANRSIKSNILHLGHHGSRTSSGERFLENVAPEIAIYSAGIDNDYGHPHSDIIDRLEGMQIPVYGTDEYGTIKIISDGHQYWLE
jgi:beta-lactamase superfamily II metal-dependent hydrolase